MKNGLYAVNFGGGQVDITSGKFVFSASEAYLIEDGKIGPAVKGATLIGNGPDALTKVTMIGNDLRLDDGIGTCGKDGQGVPVGVGQPTLADRRADRRRHERVTRGVARLPRGCCSPSRRCGSFPSAAPACRFRSGAVDALVARAPSTACPGW